jgi:regulator of protease activity HflC (stomatin/prohibitin superfamily)
LSGPAEPGKATVPPRPDPGRDAYRGVVVVLAAAALAAALTAAVAGVVLWNPLLLDGAVTLGLATALLIGVALAERVRLRQPRSEPDPGAAAPPAEEPVPPPVPAAADEEDSPADSLPRRLRLQARDWYRDFGPLARWRRGVAGAGTVAVVLALLAQPSPVRLAAPAAVTAAALALLAAGLAATAARYLAGVEPAELPEAPGLSRAARVVAWILVLIALSMAAAWGGQRTTLVILHFLVGAINLAACYGLLRGRRPPGGARAVFPVEIGVFSLLGSRPNALASLLDAAQRHLGIDLRSTWALTVVRRTLEPLLVGLALLGWWSTSLTVVRVGEEGLVERLGVLQRGQPLQPGLHLHWPWPVDRVLRLPVREVETLTVGHEGGEEAGPENVLWAVQHAANEYTLLLGNGRDLITVDAALDFRIRDPVAWRYDCQNPADALRAIAYRAVMRSTVYRTLDEALSENLAELAASMRDMVQKEADSLGLGVEVVAFTIGGLHPPVRVAADYQAVVSAELGAVTAAVLAAADRTTLTVSADAAVTKSLNAARAEGAEALARAAGEAWSFRTLEAQYRAAPQEFFFRRRLETLEQGLAVRTFTIVDFRIERDGGELWLMP